MVMASAARNIGSGAAVPTDNTNKGMTREASGVNGVPRMALARYRLRLRARSAVSLPPYAGSAWRGALGHALKERACTAPGMACAHCPAAGGCAYLYMFETPRPEGAEVMRRYERVPVPFVLEVPAVSRPLAPGEETTVGMTLIGRAIGFLPVTAEAFALAAARGVGAGAGRLALEALEREAVLGHEDWREAPRTERGLGPGEPSALITPPWPGEAEIRFETPLRLTSDGRTLGKRDVGFPQLFGSLLRRVSMLAYFHGDTPWEAEFAELTEAARALRFSQARLEWHDWRRYSNRQSRHVPMGGVVGQAAIAGEAFAPFWPLLWLGQWLHAGKGTVMGLGRYRISAASLPRAVSAAERGTMHAFHDMTARA
jgi:hypothetical protein